MEKKLSNIDIARGIAILLVVIGHTITKEIANSSSILTNVRLIIYTIHMPIFFVISGYLFEKNRKKYLQNGKCKYIKDKFLAFMIPYISISILGYLLISISFNFTPLKEILKQNGFFIPSILNFIKMVFTYINHFDNHLWFLYTMFIILISNILFFHKNKTTNYLFIGLILYILSAYYSSLLPEIIWKTFKYNFIFIFGRKVYQKELDKSKNAKYVILFLLLIALPVFMANFAFPKLINCLLKLIVEITSSYIIIFLVASLIKEKNIFSYLGNGTTSMIIYLFHMPFLLPCLVFLFQKLNLNLVFNIITSTLLSIVVCLILKKVIENSNILSFIFVGKKLKESENMKKKNRKPRLCLVSSSGGHWEQLQKLQPLIDKYDGFLVTEKTQFEAKAKYLMKQTDLKDKLMPIKMLWNAFYTLIIWIKERPDFVITTGTMVAYPFYLLAVLFRKKFIFIETFGRANMPTVAGKKMEKHSDLFIVQWESQKKHYKKAIYGGCLY